MLAETYTELDPNTCGGNHHDACPCREEYFGTLDAEMAKLRDHYDGLAKRIMEEMDLLRMPRQLLTISRLRLT